MDNNNNKTQFNNLVTFEELLDICKSNPNDSDLGSIIREKVNSLKSEKACIKKKSY